ncbi:MAG: hypothetical protein OER80_05745 [Gammaproteobacteria bacterium]|nr:hypothetical protein [Gammaproteobacteria bacterium]MDH3768554.1 hypothetical protein [Gammaproteobacteria bacterium]
MEDYLDAAEVRLPSTEPTLGLQTVSLLTLTSGSPAQGRGLASQVAGVLMDFQSYSWTRPSAAPPECRSL